MANVLLPGMIKFLRTVVAPVVCLLNAPFTAGDQDYADAQVLNTVGEGITDGQLTVVEVDGTLAIVSNKCAFTAQATPAWGDLGFYSQAITKALGLVLLGTINSDATKQTLFGLVNAQALSYTDFEYTFHVNGTLSYGDNAGGWWTAVIGAVSSATDYEWALVLGGYDVSRVPWRSGEAGANYLYGASLFIKGGAYTNWTLLWRTHKLNTATLYAAVSIYDGVGTLDDFRVPDADLSAVLQPNNLSTFADANGTSLDAITPEVGGAWTEQSGTWDIQTNKARATDIGSHALAVVESGIADMLVKATLISADTNGYPALMIRNSDSTHLWICQLHNNLNNITLFENNAGYTTRAEVGVAILDGTSYEMCIIAVDEQIDCFLDVGVQCSYGSAAFNKTATKHGLDLYRSAGVANDRFDNFYIHLVTATVYDDELDAV